MCAVGERGDEREKEASSPLRFTNMIIIFFKNNQSRIGLDRRRYPRRNRGKTRLATEPVTKED